MSLSYEIQWWILFGAALVEGALVIVALFCIAFEIHELRRTRPARASGAQRSASAKIAPDGASLAALTNNQQLTTNNQQPRT